MNIRDLRPRQISAGRFLVLGAGYLIITAAVAAVLLFGQEFDWGLTLFGVRVHPLLYTLPFAFLSYKLQHGLSDGYGGAHAADLAISLPMLGVVLLTLIVWAEMPIAADILIWLRGFVANGIPAPDEYRLGVVLIFGISAVIDVLFRDILGVLRRRRAGAIPLGGHHPLEISAAVHFTPDVFKLKMPDGELLEIPGDAGMLQALKRAVRERYPDLNQIEVSMREAA